MGCDRVRHEEIRFVAERRQEAAMEVRRMQELTWEEVAEYLRISDALLVPIGTCEQHGRHLPLATDRLITEAFTDAIAEATGVLVAPTLAYGVNLPCDRFVPGTAGFSFDGLRESVRSLLEDWNRQGFRRFFVVTAHGCASDGFGFAHHEALKEAALPLLTSGRARVSILFPYWTDLSDLLTGQDGPEHACEVETALALLLFPGLVHKDRIEDGPVEDDDARFDAYPEGVASGPPATGWNGAEGTPANATSEQGRHIFERCLIPLVEHVRSALGN
jgi:creatinine amidohydrolase